MINLTELHEFIVSAKAATYVGDGKSIKSCRKGSHDLSFADGNYRYLDSYFGGANFIGEEVVYENEMPVWGMNYYGRILKPQKITAAQAGMLIKASLSQMYALGRFLGGWEYKQDDLTYTIRPMVTLNALPVLNGSKKMALKSMSLSTMVD